MTIFRIATVHVSALILLSACAGTGEMPALISPSEAVPPQDLTANLPSTDPTGQPLPDNTGQNVAGSGTQPDHMAAPGGTAVGRADLLGGWKVAAGSDSCQLFMSLTGWAGGYRAVTRGCSSDLLASVQAWNLNEQEIMLLNENGEAVARLFATEKTRLNGQTDDGLGVTVFR